MADAETAQEQEQVQEQGQELGQELGQEQELEQDQEQERRLFDDSKLEETRSTTVINESFFFVGQKYIDEEDKADERKPDIEGVVTGQHLKDIAHELGLIKLCWADVPQLYFEEHHYPVSYLKNNRKEMLLLWYAENFRQQFTYKYPKRRPLLIACDNECGVQKMVSTTIRPTNMRFPEFETWQGCANFVADFLKYEELQNPTVLPDHINSPQTVLKRQAGHCFEFSIVLASFLIGSGYDAYVVSGYATREICWKDQSRVECPFLQDEPEVEEEEEEEKDEKYFLKKPVQLKSQFLAEMEAREIQKELDARIVQELAELEAIKEFEKPPPDDLWGWRLHSWIVILPSKDVVEPFFIESTTGVPKSIDDPNYHGIESIWNHQNYCVLVQLDKKSETCKDISFDLKNPAYWLRLLIGEPITFREFPPEILEADIDEFRKACIDVEKHLDMPYSWVDKLELSHTAYERRFPGAKKVLHYRKAISEQFSPYSQTDGLVERVTRYDDYDCEQPNEIRERYKNRSDLMYFSQKALEENLVIEKFYRGREDALKERYYYSSNTSVETKFSLVFYTQARLDGLFILEMDPLFMTVYFKDRPDFQYYFHVEFAEKTNQYEPLRVINKITEKFHRNPKKDADKDVAMVEYCYADEKLLIKFHYEPEHVTQTTRDFMKSTSAEKGAEITFDPSLTRGYLTGPLVPSPKPLYLFRLEVKYFEQEEIVKKKTRDWEDELLFLLRLRSRELAVPHLVVSEFDVERNEEAKKAFKEREQEKREILESHMKMTCDFLAPYYSKLGIKPKTILPQKLALQVVEKCLKDWKIILVERANAIQQQFERICQELQERNNWYEQNQSSITKEQEEEYFDFCKRNSYHLYILEVRLNRHKERASQIFQEIQSYIRNDPRVVSAFRRRRRHK